MLQADRLDMLDSVNFIKLNDFNLFARKTMIILIKASLLSIILPHFVIAINSNRVSYEVFLQTVFFPS